MSDNIMETDVFGSTTDGHVVTRYVCNRLPQRIRPLLPAFNKLASLWRFHLLGYACLIFSGGYIFGNYTDSRA